MKKTFFTSMLFVMLLVMLSAIPVSASETPVKVTINGNPIQYNSETGYPFIDSIGRVQVPLRQTMEEFGCMVSWSSETQCPVVSKDYIGLILPIGSNQINKIDSLTLQRFEIISDSVPTLKNGRTYLPIRIVLENFGAKVNWDSKNKEVLITTTNENINYNKKTNNDVNAQVNTQIFSILGKSVEELKEIYGYNYKFAESDSWGVGHNYTYNDNVMFCYSLDDPLDAQCVRIECIPNVLIPDCKLPITKTDLSNMGMKGTFDFDFGLGNYGPLPAYYSIPVSDHINLFVNCTFNGEITESSSMIITYK